VPVPDVPAIARGIGRCPTVTVVASTDRPSRSGQTGVTGDHRRCERMRRQS
jgi:hypothetical protein